MLQIMESTSNRKQQNLFVKMLFHRIVLCNHCCNTLIGIGILHKHRRIPVFGPHESCETSPPTHTHAHKGLLQTTVFTKQKSYINMSPIAVNGKYIVLKSRETDKKGYALFHSNIEQQGYRSCCCCLLLKFNILWLTAAMSCEIHYETGLFLGVQRPQLCMSVCVCIQCNCC